MKNPKKVGNRVENNFNENATFLTLFSPTLHNILILYNFLEKIF